MSESSNKVKRRRTLNRRDGAELLERATFLGNNKMVKIEAAETSDGEAIYLLDNEVMLFQIGEEIYHTALPLRR